VTAFVIKRTDGQLRVERAIRWEYLGAVQPELSEADLRNEVRLHMRDIGVGEEPLIGFGDGGEPRLVWPTDIERTARPLVSVLGAEIRRSRRVRRSLHSGASKRQNLAVGRPSKPKRVIELLQESDGRWRPVDASESARETLAVPRRIISEIRDHANELAPDGLESVGRLIAVDGRVREYRRLRNLRADAGVPGKMALGSSWRRVPGEISIIVHSHPRAGLGPSAGDIRWAAEHPLYRRMFGTFSVPLGRLAIWTLDGDSVSEVAFEMS
jgi:hypothetical protein